MAYSSLSSPSSRFTLFTIFILSPTLLLIAFAVTVKEQTRPFKKVYAFGDSFTDTGNTKSGNGPSGFGHMSSLPYGTTFFNHSTNRYSDGRLVIGFVAEALSLPYLTPYVHHHEENDTFVVNFAVAGATAINHEFFVRNNFSLDVIPQSVQTQLLWFNRYLEKSQVRQGIASGCKDFDNILFWFGEIGVNDYAYIIGSTVSPDIIRKLAIHRSPEFQALLQKGVKCLVVQGLPLSGCLPSALYLAPEDDRDNIGCVKSVNNQSYTYNLVLQAKLRELRKQNPRVLILYLDYWNAHRTVMKTPSKYGFTERFIVCCGSGEPSYNFNAFATCGSPNATACTTPSRYINWDGVHLTEAMYKVVSNMFLRGNFSHTRLNYLLDKKERHG